MYTGLIYNDFFSKSLNIFGSEWFVPYTTMSVIREKEVMLDPKNAFTDEAYPLGLDPVWQVIKALLMHKVTNVLFLYYLSRFLNFTLTLIMYLPTNLHSM